MAEQSTSQREERITCSVYRHRTLARADITGLMLWCRSCKRVHRITWAGLEQLRRALDAPDIDAVAMECDPQKAETQ